MTTAQINEFIRIYDEADESKKELLYKLIDCVKYGGDAFWNEIMAFCAADDKSGIIATINKWAAIVKGAAQ